MSLIQIILFIVATLFGFALFKFASKVFFSLIPIFILIGCLYVFFPDAFNKFWKVINQAMPFIEKTANVILRVFQEIFRKLGMI